jgi:hypothetical protein
MQKTFNVVPHMSWGSLPVHLQKVWVTPQVKCNAQLQNPPLLTAVLCRLLADAEVSENDIEQFVDPHRARDAAQ